MTVVEGGEGEGENADKKKKNRACLVCVTRQDMLLAPKKIKKNKKHVFGMANPSKCNKLCTAVLLLGHVASPSTLSSLSFVRTMVGINNRNRIVIGIVLFAKRHRLMVAFVIPDHIHD